jgi:hypothetical protein
MAPRIERVKPNYSRCNDATRLSFAIIVTEPFDNTSGSGGNRRTKLINAFKPANFRGTGSVRI